jgi:putative SOS response-associated peptidase YedK
MCGRYSLALTSEKLSKRYSLSKLGEFKPRYNVAPGQVMPIITNTLPTEITLAKWGLIPNWSLNDSTAMNLINAKGENLFTKGPFKQIVKEQRCLIPADGYYEWKKEGKNKVPYRITLSSDFSFSFAGIWDSWEDPDGEIILTFTIITTSANNLVKDIFDRMPVILDQESEKIWLDNASSEKELTEVLKPFDGSKMSYYKSHKIVTSTMYDTPECFQVAPKIYPGESFSLFE